MHDLGLRLEFMRGTGMDDGALFHEKHARAELERGFHVLFDQQDRNAALVDGGEFRGESAGTRPASRDAFGRLVQDDQLGPRIIRQQRDRRASAARRRTACCPTASGAP